MHSRTVRHRRAAEAFPVGSFIAEELAARGWSTLDLAQRMGGGNPVTDRLALDILIATDDPNVLLGFRGAVMLARAFGTSAEFWQRLEAAYRDWHPDTIPLPEASHA